MLTRQKEEQKQEQKASQLNNPPPTAVLRLIKPAAPTKSVSWAPNVVDNELLNRKSSKICCVFRKAHSFGESSSSSDDNDDDISDNSCNKVHHPSSQGDKPSKN